MLYPPLQEERHICYKKIKTREKIGIKRFEQAKWKIKENKNDLLKLMV